VKKSLNAKETSGTQEPGSSSIVFKVFADLEAADLEKANKVLKIFKNLSIGFWLNLKFFFLDCRVK
jgi:hypothetical protein